MKEAEFSFPLPPSLSAVTDTRRLTITLAWLTPVKCTNQSYRVAHLWFSAPKENKIATKGINAVRNASQRGTVQHEVFEDRTGYTFRGRRKARHQGQLPQRSWIHTRTHTIRPSRHVRGVGRHQHSNVSDFNIPRSARAPGSSRFGVKQTFLMAPTSTYPNYKPSGLKWLADIPAHWRTERAKWLLKKMKRSVRDTDEVVTCFRDGVVTLRKNRRTEGFTESIQEMGYQGIRGGDLVIHAMDAFAGAIGVADSDGKGTPVYSGLQARASRQCLFLCLHTS